MASLDEQLRRPQTHQGRVVDDEDLCHRRCSYFSTRVRFTKEDALERGIGRRPPQVERNVRLCRPARWR